MGLYPLSVPKPQKPRKNRSIKALFHNLFGYNFISEVKLFLAEQGIEVEKTTIASWCNKNHLPDELLETFRLHAIGYATRALAQEYEIQCIRADNWIESRQHCFQTHIQPFYDALAGKNELITIGPWPPKRQAAQKPLQIREALARGSAPTADRQNAADGRSAVRQEPIPTPEPIAALLDAWFPPRPKDPPIE